MARNFGRFTTDIWRDEKFRALTGGEQRTYFMLGLQPDISAAGTLPLTVRRWSEYAADSTPDALSDALSGLEDKRFVYLDLSTEELLIRSFVKWDGGIRNDKRRPVVIEAARAVLSPKIRAILAEELAELGFPDALSDGLSDGLSDALSPFDRVVVKKGEYIPQPITGNLEREPLDDDAEPPLFCSKHPKGTEQSCGPCATARRRRDIWQQTAPARAAEKRKHALVREALANSCDRCDGTWIVDADRNPTRRKCDHRRSA